MQECGDFTGEYSYNANQRIARYIFGLALAISLIWHLFWIFSVRIFMTPIPLSKGLTSNVSFLGSILDEESVYAYERTLAPGSLEVKHPPLLGTADIFMAENIGINYIEGPIFKADFDMLKEKKFKLSARDELTATKGIPSRPFDKIKVSYKAYPSQIKGPLRFREVVYKPDLPSYLRWDEELGVDFDRLGDSFDMELKFWVSAEGKVELVERVSSSGHPTVDLVGIRYLKGWQFAPIAVGESKGEEWGIIKLKFSLKKTSSLDD